MTFRDDFYWGASTCAYQIEGSPLADGKGLSIWDVFCRTEGHIRDGSSGDVACDHYRLYESDVALMAELGIKAYRFSISWARIMPDGRGKINPNGIDFYKRLLACLEKHGITPFVTLYHWDLPYELHKRGGWLNPEISDWFADYARAVVENLPEITNYITLNEPQVFLGCGYDEGRHAPGLKLPKSEQLQIGHNILLAHGKAVIAMRKAASHKLNIGIAMASSPPIPVNETAENIKACESVYANADKSSFIFTDAYWLDPIVFGSYPDGMAETCADIMPEIKDGDMKLIRQPIDFIGQNIYRGNYFDVDGSGCPVYVKAKPGAPRTAIYWDITQEALYWGARLCCERYHLPYFITEGGMSAHDVVSLDGKVHDPNRIDYLNRYLSGLLRASDEGYDVRGYFMWSLLDNFEWAEGHAERFGIIFTDFTTQQRIPKDSAYWYKSVIESNGEILQAILRS